MTGAPMRDAVVRAVEDVGRTVRQFDIVPCDAESLVWAPGAHIDVEIPGPVGTDLRQYSLVGLPNGGAYRVAVKLHAESRGGSRHMWQLAAGDTIRVSRPKNLFALKPGCPEYLLVAGGIGITPIHGMALSLARAGARVRLVYAARSRVDMPFVEALAAALGDRLVLKVGDEGGRIDIAAEIARLHKDGELYLCGPLSLLEDAKRAWSAAARPPASLRYETFGASGDGVEAFTVKIPGLGREIEVSETMTMLDALAAEGIETISDCRRGECGICAVDVVAADGRIDHRDVFFSDEQKAQGKKMCPCVSRVAGGSVTIDTAWRPDALPRA